MLVLGILFLLLSSVHASLVERQATYAHAQTALVIAASTSAADEAVSTLNKYNQPSQVLVLTQNGALPALETTTGSTTVGNFGLIVIISLASYNNGAGWSSAITSNQWITLNAYQLKYGIRVIHLDSYPGNFPGTAIAPGPGGCCSTDEQQVYLLNSSLVPPGGQIANYSTVGLWHYPAIITDYSQTSPFLAFRPNNEYHSQTVAGVIQNLSGRMQMVIFLTGASWSSTSNYLGQVWITWGYGATLGQTSPHAGTALVIASDAGAADEAISTLNGYAQSYQLLTVPSSGTALPTLQTVNSLNQPYGNFGLIIVISLVAYNYGGTTGWASALTTAQWNQLYSYQSQFGVGMVHLDGYPNNFPGATIAPGPGGCCSSEDQYVYAVNTSLVAAAGLTVTNLTTVGLWHYPATITDTTTTTPFIQFAPNNEYTSTTVAGVLQNLSGRQQMVFFITGGSWSSTTNYLGKLWYTWGYQGQTGSTTSSSSSSSISTASSTTSSTSTSISTITTTGTTTSSTSTTTTSTAPRATGTGVTEFTPYQSVTAFGRVFTQHWTGYGCIMNPQPTFQGQQVLYGSALYPGQDLTTTLSNCSTVCYCIQI